MELKKYYVSCLLSWDSGEKCKVEDMIIVIVIFVLFSAIAGGIEKELKIDVCFLLSFF